MGLLAQSRMAMAAQRNTKRHEWEDRLRRFDVASMTVAKFCFAEGVSVPSFYQWKRKLRGSKDSKPSSESNASGSFAQIQVTAPQARVVLPNGVEIILGSDPKIVAAIVDRVIGGMGPETC